MFIGQVYSAAVFRIKNIILIMKIVRECFVVKSLNPNVKECRRSVVLFAK